MRRVLAVVVGLMMVGAAWAQRGTVQMEAFPAMAVADGRSTLTITVVVRDSGGSLVPDGTQVVIETTLGTFRDRLVTTRNGLARAILVAGNQAGTARIKATALRADAVGETEVEFVQDRSLLASAKDFIEVVGSETLLYSPEQRVIEASGPGGKAVVRYRDVEIVADDVQVRVPNYEVKARRGRMRIGRTELSFDTLFFRLNRRTGHAIGTYRQWVRSAVMGIPGGYRDRVGLLDVTVSGARRSENPIPDTTFRFQDLSDSMTLVRARKITASPSRDIQFHRADVRMDGDSILRMPLFKINAGSTSPLVTEQIVDVSNNNVALNYPHFLSLKPGETSLLRFRYGNRYTTGAGAAGGMFLDYEWNWNRGLESEGGFTLAGIGRRDWGLGFRQGWFFQDSSSLNFQIDAPAHRSVFTAVNMAKPLGGYSLNLNGTYGQSLTGTRFRSDSASFVIERDPTPIKPLKANFTLGLGANRTRAIGPGISNTQESVGLNMRLASNPIRIDNRSTLFYSYFVRQQSGRNARNGLTQVATLGVNTAPARGWVLSTGYEYQDDGQFGSLIGRHRVTAETFFSTGRFSLSSSFRQSLDADRSGMDARMRYELGPLWRFSFSHYFDRFGIDSFQDQAFVLSYRLGFREIGLSYSTRTRRLGLDLLGTSFN